MDPISLEHCRAAFLAVMFFVGEAYLDVGMLAAAMVVSTLPVILVYIFISEWFIQGMTVGTIKG